MIKRKSTLKILAGILLSPALIAWSGFLSLRPAQSYPEAFEVSLDLPDNPVDYGAPSRTQGGGVRGDGCIADEEATVMALIPGNVWTTLSDRPTFLWYIPQTNAEKAEFALLDAQYNEIHKNIINLSNENSGTILQETLPEDVALETGVSYTWQFSMICDPKRRSGDIFIEGEVKKVDFQDRELEALETELETAEQDPVKQAEAYLNAAIYNEGISLLAETRCKHKEDWEQLLNWMGLGELATDTLAQCEAEDI